MQEKLTKMSHGSVPGRNGSSAVTLLQLSSEGSHNATLPSEESYNAVLTSEGSYNDHQMQLSSEGSVQVSITRPPQT